MWRNYLTVGIRALTKNKTYAFINIVGLAIGLAACLLLLVYVRYETSYDRWLPNAENTYEFQTHFKNPQTGEEGNLQMTAYVSGQRLKADFPQVDRMVYALSAEPVIRRGLHNVEVMLVGVEFAVDVPGLQHHRSWISERLRARKFRTLMFPIP